MAQSSEGTRIGFHTIVLNGGDYFYYSLLNTYNLASKYPGSKIVIVEGADQFTADEVNKTGLSVDRTECIIRNFPDPLRIIHYVKMGFVSDKRFLRNKCLEMLGETDFILIKDHDEFIKPEDLDALVLEMKNGWTSVELKHIMFRGDFTRKILDGGYAFRAIKTDPGVYYKNWHIFPSFWNGEELHKDLRGKHKRLEIPFYHYGHIGSGARIYWKRVFTISQLNYYFTFINPNSEYKTLSRPDITPFLTPVVEHPDHTVTFSLEDHPGEIKQHPWFNWKQGQIWAYPDPFPTFVPGDFPLCRSI